MAGGYQEDCYEYGFSTRDNCYRFFHWNLADIFVYFGHHRICIPPLPYINIAH